eukprot:c21769_g2_i5.p1 GENE.c21769_g2_i5~~c21769_g2_i5.p1  ORF type:complete len:247 (-),score=95.01 c21769_g2_i5:32-742(-)
MNNFLRTIKLLVLLEYFVLADDSCTVSVSGNTYNFGSVGTAQISTTFTVDPCKAPATPNSYCPITPPCPGYQSPRTTACYCLGDISQVTWTEATNFKGLTGTYISGTNGRSLVVEMECSDSETPPADVTETPLMVYTAHWKSKSACVGAAGGGGGGGGSGVGIVGIIDLVLVFGFLGFLGAGSVYNWKVKSKAGADVIPFRTVWTDVPFLVKDGFLFFFGSIKTGLYRVTGKTEAI